MMSKTRTVGLALSAALAFGGVAACSSSSSGGSASSVKPVANIPHLSGLHTQVALDSGFAAALKSLKVTPGLIGTATLSKAGVLTFPITGGNVKYYKKGTVNPYVQGLILHQGSGFSLTAGGTTVGLSNFEVNPGNSVLYGKVTANHKVVAARAPLFYLDGATLQPLQTGPNNTAILQGTKVYLSVTAAALLDKTYHITALSRHTLVGVAKITVNTT